jgi:hypothetical protein
MAVNYVKGQILSSNLERDGVDISISNANVGIGTLFPAAKLEVVGNVIIGNVQIGNIGVISASGNITGGNLVAVTSINAATGNIVGNITVGNLSTSGNVATGNLLTDNLLHANGVPWDFQQPAGANTQLQFNDNDSFGASPNLTFDTAANLLTVNATANISNLNVSGSTVIQGNISATGNVIGGNLITVGNAVVGGILTDNYYYANGAPVDFQQPAGSNTEIQYNDDQDFGASSNFTYNYTTGVLAVGYGNSGSIETDLVTVSGNISANNATIGNALHTNTLQTTGNTIIGGNLTVQGNITYINVDTFDVEDPIITIGVGANGQPLVTNDGKDRGVAMDYYNSGLSQQQTAFFGYKNSSSSNLIMASNVTIASEIVTVIDWGTVQGGNAYFGNALIDGIATIGTLNITSLSVPGNITGGNLISNAAITAIGNVVAGNVITPTVITSTVTTGSGDLTLNSASGQLQWDGSGNIVMNSQWINNLSNPTAAYDAATKQYVDDATSSGIHIHAPVYLETPAALPATTYAQGGNIYTVTDTVAGNTVVFSTTANLQPNDQLWFGNSFQGIVGNTSYFVVSAPNTSAAVLTTTYNGAPVGNITSASGLTENVRVNSGIGATLTANASGTLTVDGVNPSISQRVLVYNQTPAYENGVYTVTQTGNISTPWILTRATDADTYVPDTNDGIDQGSYFYVQAGDTGAGESYVLTAPSGPFIIGLANIEFTQFSASQVYSANTAAGLTLTGTVFSAKVDNNTTAFDGNGNIIVKSGANLVTPNIGNAVGNSLTLTGNLSAANVNALTGVFTDTLTATGNISAGNVSSGNISAGNVSSGNISITANVYSGNIINLGGINSTGNISTPANIQGNYLIANSAVVGNITITDLTVGNIEASGYANIVGNITGGNLLSNGAVSATTTVSAGGNITGGNLVTAGGIVATTANIANLRMANTTITTDGTIGNIVIEPIGSGVAYFKTTTGLILPVGNTTQRPAPATQGTMRFNTENLRVEVYDGTEWDQIVSGVTNQTTNGDGSTTTFTLDRETTTAAALIMLNGIVQLPGTAYNMSPNPSTSLVFTEAPAEGDIIDIRFL